MLMDRAANVHKVSEAWNQVGYGNAGAGVKIAVIDSGNDITHPAFLDPSLTMPAGFPKVTNSTDQQYTNNKVIVARSYVNLLPGRDPDRSAQDHVGHGTALAMVAAGARSDGPLASIAGIAPKAYVGNYKVFGSPGSNDTTTDDAILKAIDDAVADGMDVINLSLGDDLAPRLQDDLLAQGVEWATRAGVIVVVAAGNNGPGVNTVASPATAPSAIAVGASSNDRTFAASAEVDGLQPLVAIPANGVSASAPVSGPAADVATLDQNGLSCGTLPAGSLQGRVALILRGDCTFETKINNARSAGAIAVLVYAAQSAPDPFIMDIGAATLPAEMIGYDDGILVKQAIAANGAPTTTLRFTLGAVFMDADRLASFSPTGPGVDTGIKPDLVAVGTDVYVATQRLDPAGDMYDSTGFLLTDGTSFSTPIVAGAAALVKAARPGLTVDQYRSLLINSAAAVDAKPGTPAHAQQAGSGLLNVAAAVRGTASAVPATLNFGTGGAQPALNRTLVITNLASTAETYSIEVTPRGEDFAPVAATNTVQLAPGASMELPVSWTGSTLAAGPHEGVVRIVAATTGDETRVPYWYAVASDAAANITLLETATTARRGSRERDAVLFRVTDASGLPLPTASLDVSVVSGNGSVESVDSYDREVPGLFGLTVRLGRSAGANVFKISAGTASIEVSITGQ
jgi:subtilisin family serine protease